MSIYDKSSLVLIPSGTKTGKVYSQKPVSGDGDFTFTRSSAATRVNADGNIEKETQNTAEHSNTFNDWSNKTNASLTSGQSGYDGTNDAWLMQATAASFCYIFDTPTTNTGIRTRSVYAKAGTHSTITLLWNSFNNNEFATFDLSAGTFTNAGCLADIEDVGSGWYRCISTITDASNAYACLISISDETGSAATIGDNIYIQDFQQENGLVARDYIETTTAAVEGGITDNVPRLDYTDSSCPALLLEPQRTNLINHSEYGAGASLSNMTATSNAATSPEGVSNATTMQTGITGQCQVYQSFNASTGNHTGSVFLKKVDFDWAYMEVGGAVAWFNIGSGTLGNGSAYGSSWTYVNHTIEDYGDGWYRCTLTGNCVSAGGYTFRSLQPVSNNNGYFSNLAGGDTHWFGTQVEAGSYATSYIPSYGSSVTRVGETNSVTDVSDLIGQTEGTLFIEFKKNIGNDAANILFSLSDGTTSNLIYHNLTSRVIEFIADGVVVAKKDPVVIADGVNKLAIYYKANDFGIYLNGVSIHTDTSGGVPIMSKLNLGNYYNDTFPVGTPINQALLFKTRLSNEELADLTTL